MTDHPTPPASWDPGPAPPPDGLSTALRAADRRRLRTVLASASVPLAVTCALLASPTAGGGAAGLDMAPAGPGGRGATPSAFAAARSEDTVTAHGAARSGDTDASSGGPGRVAPPTGLPTALPTLPTPSGGPSTSPDQSRGFAAAHTASTHVDLPATVHPDFRDAAITVGGTYGGVYLVSDDGTVAGGVLVEPGPDGRRIPTTGPSYGTEIGDASELPAGGYTVYVVGDGATEVAVELAAGEHGLTVTASGPATAAYRRVVDVFATGATSANRRLAVDADGTSVGIAGAWLDSQGNHTNARVTACLAVAASPCTGDDPQDTSTVGVGLAGSAVGAGVVVENGLLDGGRDLVTHGEAAAATDGTLVTWYLVLDL